MPRGVPGSGRSVKQTPVTDDPNVDTFDEMMEGYPEAEQEIPLPRTDIHDPIVPSNVLGNTQSVTLVNLKYPNEIVFLPQDRLTEKGWTHNNFSPQDFLQFTDGVLVCTEDQADVVQKQCSYVKREPAEGELITYQPSGFSTRSAAIYAEHVQRYNEDFVG